MKTIKDLFLTTILTIVISLTSFTQEVTGFTFQSSKVAYANDNYSQTYSHKDIFSMSLNDGYFFHIVINANNQVVNSQVYKLADSDVDIYLEQGTIEVDFIVISGLSGLTFTYKLIVDSDNNGVLISDQGMAYGGNPTVLRTYKQ